MKGFLVGFGLGVAAGMLLAPMKGEDARVMAGVKASEIADNARETYKQVKHTVGKAVNSVRSEGSTMGTGTSG
jgi:gas vesicle protein